MFCPKCKTEYVEGVSKCVDCNLDLISELLPESIPDKPDHIDYEEILATKNDGDIAILKSILDSENITYYFKGEEFNLMYPMVEPVRLMVKKDEAEKTRELLKDLKLSFTSVSLETADNSDLNDSELEVEEETYENKPQMNQSSKKLKYFMRGLLVGILLAGSYSAYYIHRMRHSSGMRTYDDNKDGKPDKWVTYRNGKVSHSAYDRNSDGKIDFWYTYDDQGIVIRSQEDNDFNSIPDITHYYVDGILDSAEFHPNGSAIIIKKQFYENGVLKEEWVDTNYDGKFDEKNTYDFTGDKISSSPL
jgi:antitoxin component YwqK of YwqJK toxin-antitoxin module